MKHFLDQGYKIRQWRRVASTIAVLGACYLSVWSWGSWSGGAGAIASEMPPPMPPFSIQTPAQRLQGQRQSLAVDQVLNRLATQQVVYLGETHDEAGDHELQLAIIQALYQRQPNLVIAMEMFQRPYQSSIDRFLRGEIDTQALLQQTEYEKRWGFPWQFYEPIVQFAKDKQLPVIALNVPTEVTRQVGRQGLSSLTIAQRRFIPPRSALEIGPEPYRAKLREIYDSFHQGKGSNTGFDSFFQAQVLWDETMAERISQVVQKPFQQLSPNRVNDRVSDRATADHLVVVLVGQGHLWEGYGIPQRVVRRLPRFPNFQQSIILLTPDPELLTQLTPSTADYLWDRRIPDAPREKPSEKPSEKPVK